MGQDPQVIRQRNERNRELLADDLGALTDKLNVKKQATHKKDEVVDKVKEKIGMSGSGSSSGDGRVAQESGAVVSAIRQNPIAAIMVGYGAKKLLSSWSDRREERVSGGDDREPRYAAPAGTMVTGYPRAEVGATDGSTGSEGSGSVRDRAGEALDGARSKVSDAAGSAQERASHVADEVGDRASQLRRTARRELPTSRREVEDLVRGQPAIVGLGAFAAGAAVAAFIEHTSFEDERFGDKREELVGTVKEKAQDARETVEGGVTTALEEGREAVSDGVDEARRQMTT